MKLLLDENLSRRLVPFLQASYPQSTHVVLIGMEHADDRILWQYAKQNDFVLVSRDADFYDLGLVHGAPPKLVWLKTGNQHKAATLAALLENSEVIHRTLITEDLACVQIW